MFFNLETRFLSLSLLSKIRGDNVCARLGVGESLIVFLRQTGLIKAGRGWMNVQTRPSAPQPSVWLFIYAFLPCLFRFPAVLLSSQRRRPWWKAPSRTEAREGPQGYAIPGASPLSLSLFLSLSVLSFSTTRPPPSRQSYSNTLFLFLDPTFPNDLGISSLRISFPPFFFLSLSALKKTKPTLLKHRAHFCFCTFGRCVVPHAKL